MSNGASATLWVHVPIYSFLKDQLLYKPRRNFIDPKEHRVHDPAAYHWHCYATKESLFT